VNNEKMKISTAQKYSPLRNAWTNIHAVKAMERTTKIVPEMPRSPLNSSFKYCNIAPFPRKVPGCRQWPKRKSVLRTGSRLLGSKSGDAVYFVSRIPNAVK